MNGEELDPATSQALERVVDRFEKVVRRVGRSRGLDTADLDQLLQDVRVRLWKSGASREKLDGLGSSYLYRVAMSAAIDLLRQRRARREDALDDAEVASPAALSVAPVDVAEREELARRMRDALATLARNRRIVVQLHLEGYERTEIATLTSWSEAKVRNLLYRGLDDLRAALSANKEGQA
ncbi:MAG: sigma-70 family RNA polymerase sigma factor [Gemmatimonadaceae bacterium]